MTGDTVHPDRNEGEGFDRERVLQKHYVREFLTKLLVEVGGIPPDRIRDEAALDADLQMESVAFIEIQIALEEKFEIEIDLLRIVEINELAGIVQYLYDLACQALCHEPGD